MKKEIEKVLLRVTRKLKENRINFAIVGSISLYLQGMDVNLHDIDILTNEKGIKKLVKIFSKYKKEGIISEKEELKNSFYFCHFALLKINGVGIDVLADTWAKNKKTGKIHKSNLKLKKYVKYKNRLIPIMPIEEELKAKEIIMYKPNRINKIREFIDEKSKRV